MIGDLLYVVWSLVVVTASLLVLVVEFAILVQRWIIGGLRGLIHHLYHGLEERQRRADVDREEASSVDLFEQARTWGRGR